MIQPPDFKERQILFLNLLDKEGRHLHLRNENLLVKNKEGKVLLKVLTYKLIAVFLRGDCTITTKLLSKIDRVGASLYFLSNNLAVKVAIESYAEGNYLIRQKQYTLAPEKELIIAKHLVANKVRNSLALLRGAGVELIAGKKRMAYKKEVIRKIKDAQKISTLRGLEGIVSKDYFQAYFATINWYRRAPRTKIDENNILLDIGYTFLFNFVDSLLRVYGLDTYKGIYHRLFFNRKSLAADMMEPFRCIIDKTLVKMHNLKQFEAKDFGRRQHRYYLKPKKSGKYARIFLEEILRYKMDIYHYIRHHYYYILNNEENDKELPDFVIR